MTGSALTLHCEEDFSNFLKVIFEVVFNKYLFFSAGSGASLSCGSMTLSGSQSPTIHPVVGQLAVPIATNLRSEHQHQQLQQQQQFLQNAAADVHEPATTSSDVTSIASQSPPHDAGQKRIFQTDIRCRFPEMLSTNAFYSNTNSRAKSEPVVENSGSLKCKDIMYDYDYDVDKMYTEFKFPTMQKRSSFAHYDAQNCSSCNDPDILKDLGDSGRETGGSSWRRSASCRELGDSHQRERLLKTNVLSETMKMMATAAENKAAAAGNTSQIKFDSIRYCYSCHGPTPVFGSSVIGKSQNSVSTKVYSNSYPGTTCRLSIENDEVVAMDGDTFLVNESDKSEYYQKVSQDDLSHDSYEILEKETVIRSRSSSVNSDEMFVMENDYASVSKHILWREGSADVEKRLGYVEPRYRNLDFNEFNEICKRGFASRNHDSSQSFSNIKFCDKSFRQLGMGHEGVSRTKSDPYVSGNDCKSLNKQKLLGLHQKSFDLPSAGEYVELEDKCFSSSCKSVIDIPYTLRIRNAMNGTARDVGLAYSDDYGIYENVKLSRRASESADDVVVKSRASHASQDSGLSLSLGTESVDDNNELDLKNMMLTKNSYEQVVTTKKSTKLMLSLSEENSENAVIDNEVTGSVKNTESKGDRGNADGDLALKGRDHSEHTTVDEPLEKHIIKVKSVEVPRKSHSGKIRKSKSVEGCDRKSSFLKTESAASAGSGSRGKKEIIVIDSDDYHSFDDSRSDKRSDGSDSVIIVEYRGNKKKKLSKKASSDSRGSQAESEASSFDAPRIKKKEFKKRNHGCYYKDRIPTIEISEDETYKVDSASAAAPTGALEMADLLSNEYEYSSDERHASGSDLSKAEIVNKILDSEKFCIVVSEVGENGFRIDNDGSLVKSEDPDAEWNQNDSHCRLEESPSTITQNETNQCERSGAVKMDRTPLLTRLGLSEGSAISQMAQNMSPSTSRRAKSLDTPIVSLHWLPPITSFSSKDDTRDNEEEEVLEDKSVRQGRSKTPSSDVEKNISKDAPPLTLTTAGKCSEIFGFRSVEIETNHSPVGRLKSNSVTGLTFHKPSLDSPLDTDKRENTLEEYVPCKERSKSEGYDKNLEHKNDGASERKHSTRQERLDSFKKLRKFSIELWDSEDVDGNRKKTDSVNSNEYDDNVFEEVESSLIDGGTKQESPNGGCDENLTTFGPGTQTKCGAMDSCVEIRQLTIVPLPDVGRELDIRNNCLPSEENLIFSPSLDRICGSSHTVSGPPVPPHRLESSGSSSVEESVLPSDCVDEDELSRLPPVPLNADQTLNFQTLSSPFNVGFFSLSRTLSRISERSTTSEQERTDFEDDSTKPLSRSLSIDDSILSSDQHPSFSSDPPSGINLENVFDDDDDDDNERATLEFVDDKLDFNIPPPLLTPEEEWPSPPCSPSSVTTPVIDSDRFVATLSPGDDDDGLKKNDEEGSVSEDKTLRDDDEELSDNGSKKFKKEKARGSVGGDDTSTTSAGITTSDWSSSTGTTIKPGHTSHSCASKSEDNSFGGECCILSSSKEATSESRKSSVDEFVALTIEPKYLTLDRKQIIEKKTVFFQPSFRSFDDEYDSPYTESEDTPSSPVPPLVFRRQPPPPPRHFQDSSANMPKLRSKVERNRMSKFVPNYTSSSMSTSLESPTNAERKLAKTVAKAKCYSYYSLARSPPSDGSSSSLEGPETPLTPNTIPRVSKRRRNMHVPRRRQQRSTDTHKADYTMTQFLAQVPHTYKPSFHHHSSRRSRR